MKKTDLEKLKALKLDANLRGTPIPSRFADASVVPDKREQRRLDQAAGLVPFACKLKQDMVKQLHDLALERNQPLHELLTELLDAGLAASNKQ